MLPKENRLNLSRDFKWVASGKKLESKFAKLFLKTGENVSPKVGIAVSAKVFKKAADRNRAKRLVSFAFQALYSDLPKQINIVALPKSGVVEVKSDEVLQDIEEVMRKEGIL